MRERKLTVAQFNAYVKGVFEDELALHDLSVEGEIYEFRQTASACFVTLKDGDDKLNCIAFDGTYNFEIGDRVSLFGGVSYYGKNAKVSFVFKSAKRIGDGSINAELLALKEKLRTEGVFDVNKPIPSPVRSVAVITAETGAVIHDFVKTAHLHRKFTDIRVFSSLVQGKTAAPDLIRNLLAADGSGCDVIVVARGGGSADDLSVFNNEQVVRCVASLVTPVISAVGHETDYTLCDYAASVRAGTPSMAGELIARINEEFFSRFYAAAERIKSAMTRAESRAHAKLIRHATAIVYVSRLKLQTVRHKAELIAGSFKSGVERVMRSRALALENYAERISAGVAQAYASRENMLKERAARLEIGNPLRILSAGYGRLYGKRGVISSITKTEIGDTINAVLCDGTVTAAVTAKHKIGE